MVEQLSRLNALEFEKGQLLDRLEQAHKENDDLQERLNEAVVSLRVIANININVADQSGKIIQVKSIAKMTLEVIRGDKLKISKMRM